MRHLRFAGFGAFFRALQVSFNHGQLTSHLKISHCFRNLPCHYYTTEGTLLVNKKNAVFKFKKGYFNLSYKNFNII